MAFDVNQFRAQLQYDGARPNLFRVQIPFPGLSSQAGVAQVKTTFMARAAQLPGMTTGTVPVFYFGRDVKLAGNRQFADWTVTVINDEDFIIRRALEQWQNALGTNQGNLRDPAFRSATSYGVDADVHQLAKTGEAIKSYKFVGMFPTDISPIDLDWSSNDTIEEFSVTFTYQYWIDVKSGVV